MAFSHVYKTTFVIVFGCVNIPDRRQVKGEGLVWVPGQRGYSPAGWGRCGHRGVSQEGLFLIPLDLCLSHVPRGKPETLEA